MPKNNFPKRLSEKIEARQQANAYREINAQHPGVDFSSNDYLGFAKSKDIHLK